MLSMKTNATNNEPQSQSQSSSTCTIKQPSSKIFKNPDDQKQFQKIYNTVDNLPLIINLQVSHGIIKNISEHATGELLKCANKKCGELIAFLHKEKDYDCDDIIKCPNPNCQILQYGFQNWCSFGGNNNDKNHSCTSMDDTADCCHICDTAACYYHLNECVLCTKWFCKNCLNLQAKNSNICCDCIVID